MANEIEQDPQDGLYGLCIFGAEHLTDDEVMKICNKFGTVVRCNRSKNLVFIRYAKREEAIACLNSDQLPFQVRTATRKKNSNRDSVGSSRDSSWKNNDGDFHKRRNDGDSHHRGGGGSNDGDFHKRRSDGDFHHRGGGGSGDNFDVGRPMPDLVPVIKNENGNLAPTHQVLIGNLPHRMNQCDVYEFCQRCKSSPIHVEMKTMNYPPNPLIRYAEVYVKTERDADNIVEALNNLAISDHQLVVCRPQ
uniref:RRM domain-containing protein n=1 Tax=Homalodisca liturata TaxID=320908 RepID=A0A1B6HIZ3_9HEMI